MSTRPNILFINTDQQTWDALSAYGNRWLSTPHMDRLVASGTSFMRSYCTDPVCAPARTSWATGRYTSEAGVPFNGGHLHADVPDLGPLLRAGGYGAGAGGAGHHAGRGLGKPQACFGGYDANAGLPGAGRPEQGSGVGYGERAYPVKGCTDSR